MARIPKFVFSYPKSGRTWLRFILANYLNDIYGLGLEIDMNSMFNLLPNNGQDPLRGLPAYKYAENEPVPLIVFDHTYFDQAISNFKSVFILRNALDTIVSQYFQMTYRIGSFQGTLTDFVRQSSASVTPFVDYLNSWAGYLNNASENHLLITYENLHTSIEETVSKVLDFLNLPCEKEQLKSAIELSTFARMKKIEISKGFPNPNIQFNANNALRAREGAVGGFTKHLNEDDIAFIRAELKERLSDAAKTVYMNSGLSL